MEEKGKGGRAKEGKRKPEENEREQEKKIGRGNEGRGNGGKGKGREEVREEEGKGGRESVGTRHRRKRNIPLFPRTFSHICPSPSCASREEANKTFTLKKKLYFLRRKILCNWVSIRYPDFDS
jgi:hypothetical protein